MKTSIIVQNLKCGGCANTIITKLNTLDGIDDVNVDVETSKVTFNYTSTNALILVENTLIKLGYPPLGIDNPLAAKAKSFVSCAIGKMS